MKLTFQKDDLLNGINIVLKAVPSKTTMPILECILIDASDNQIKLTANDMELGIETKVEGSILSRGKIALDAKLLSEIIRKLSGGESDITIESDEKYNTTITCDNSVSIGNSYTIGAGSVSSFLTLYPRIAFATARSMIFN